MTGFYNNYSRFIIIFLLNCSVSFSQKENVLPVELIYFTGTMQVDGVLLNWGTATEVNNYGFEIERSSNGIDFTAISFVDGYGNSFSQKDYSYKDTSTINNTAYHYRLKQIDTDGKFEYSNIISIDYITNILKEIIIPEVTALGNNYPNPFNPSTIINFSLEKKGKASISIMNLAGEVVKTYKLNDLDAGTHKVLFNAEGLSSGIYIIVLKTDDKLLSKKMNFIK